jgi:hypothetical protein
VAPPTDPRAKADTVRGIIAIVGSEPMTQVVVREPNGGPSVTLTGMPVRDVARTAGADVVLRGVRTSARELVVNDFTVRSVDGVPAMDGVLQAADGGYVLVLANGTRHRVPSPPPSLRNEVGSRVWITGPAGAPPHSFGVIVPHL